MEDVVPCVSPKALAYADPAVLAALIQHARGSDTGHKQIAVEILAALTTLAQNERLICPAIRALASKPDDDFLSVQWAISNKGCFQNAWFIRLNQLTAAVSGPVSLNPEDVVLRWAQGAVPELEFEKPPISVSEPIKRAFGLKKFSEKRLFQTVAMECAVRLETQINNAAHSALTLRKGECSPERWALFEVIKGVHVALNKLKANPLGYFAAPFFVMEAVFLTGFVAHVERYDPEFHDPILSDLSTVALLGPYTKAVIVPDEVAQLINLAPRTDGVGAPIRAFSLAQSTELLTFLRQLEDNDHVAAPGIAPLGNVFSGQVVH